MGAALYPILDPDLSGVIARARDVLELNAARRWKALVELISKHLTFFIFDQFEFSRAVLTYLI